MEADWLSTEAWVIAALVAAAAVTAGLRIRERLRTRAERDRLFTLSQDLLCVLEMDGTVVHGNPAFERYFPSPSPSASMPPGERLPLNRFFSAIHPEDLAAVRHTWDLPFDEVPPIEFRVRLGKGWRWLSWAMRRDRLGGRHRFYAVAHDITSRKLAEQTLASETAFRRAMEDSIWTGMRAIDTEGRITYVNPAFCRLTGYEASDLVGAMPPYPYWPHEDYPVLMSQTAAVLAGTAPTTGLTQRIRRRDGALMQIALYLSPLIDERGRQSGWMASMADITEPNRIRQELADAHVRFTTVLDELGAAVSVAPLAPKASIDEPLLFANRQYRAIFGTSGRGHRELLTGGPSGSDWVAREVFVARAERWFEVRSRRIVWVDGDPVRLVVANDITAARHAREVQEQQVEQLQQTSRLVTMGEMASSIAHELNQPLSAISNYASGLAARLKRNAGAPGVGPEVLDAIDKTARQAQRAAAVIRRIRDFVKRSEPERRRVRVAAIVADALGLARIAAKRRRIVIVPRIAPHLPDLMADPILIEQVLINLLKNGIDAMEQQPRGELTLTVTAGEGQVRFAVADQGPGLRPDLQDRLFEPFYTTKPDGMGIGLNICRSIVESHGGRLWAEDNIPHGCVFQFVLPAATTRDGHASPCLPLIGTSALARVATPAPDGALAAASPAPAPRANASARVVTAEATIGVNVAPELASDGRSDVGSDSGSHHGPSSGSHDGTDRASKIGSNDGSNKGSESVAVGAVGRRHDCHPRPQCPRSGGADGAMTRNETDGDIDRAATTSRLTSRRAMTPRAERRARDLAMAPPAR